jgi:hypothetical protein
MVSAGCEKTSIVDAKKQKQNNFFIISVGLIKPDLFGLKTIAPAKFRAKIPCELASGAKAVHVLTRK